MNLLTGSIIGAIILGIIIYPILLWLDYTFNSPIYRPYKSLNTFKDYLRDFISDRWSIIFFIIPSLFISSMFVLLYVSFTIIEPRNREEYNIKQSLIEQHLQNKCPDCKWINDYTEYKFDKNTGELSPVYQHYNCIPCDTLEKELKQKMKEKYND